jgi:hypothetical protein
MTTKTRKVMAGRATLAVVLLELPDRAAEETAAEETGETWANNPHPRSIRKPSYD